MLGSRIVSKSVTAGLLIALLVTALVPATAAAAVSPLRFNVYMGDGCIGGVASTASPGINLMWTGQDGSYKLDSAFLPNPDGTFSTCSFPPVTVEAGDRIYADDGISTHELIVPQMTLFQNRVNDVYKGRGPAGQMVKLVCHLQSGFEPCMQTWKIRVNPQGMWSVNPHWNVLGRDNMLLQWKSAAGDFVRVWNTAPYLDITLGKAFVTGSGRAGSPVTVVLKNGSTLDVRGTAESTASNFDGRFGGRFENQQGGAVVARAGNIVTSTIAPDADFVLPNILGDANAAADLVTGQCAQESSFEYRVLRNGIEYDGRRWFTDVDGSFQADVSGLKVGDRVIIGCEQYTGDWVRKAFVAHS